MSETAVISAEATRSKLTAPSYTSFVLSVLNEVSCTAAVFVSRNFGGSTLLTRPALTRSKCAISMQSLKEGISHPTAPVTDRSYHIFCPDDRVALRLVLQMAQNPEVTTTIVFFDVNEKYFVTSAISDDHTTRPTTTISPRALEIHRNKRISADVKEAEILPNERDAATSECW